MLFRNNKSKCTNLKRTYLKWFAGLPKKRVLTNLKRTLSRTIRIHQIMYKKSNKEKGLGLVLRHKKSQSILGTDWLLNSLYFHNTMVINKVQIYGILASSYSCWCLQTLEIDNLFDF